MQILVDDVLEYIPENKAWKDPTQYIKFYKVEFFWTNFNIFLKIINGLVVKK